MPLAISGTLNEAVSEYPFAVPEKTTVGPKNIWYGPLGVAIVPWMVIGVPTIPVREEGVTCRMLTAELWLCPATISTGTRPTAKHTKNKRANATTLLFKLFCAPSKVVWFLDVDELKAMILSFTLQTKTECKRYKKQFTLLVRL